MALLPAHPAAATAAPIHAAVEALEVWGVGAAADLAARDSHRERSALFAEQRRHVDRAAFAEDLEAVRGIMGLVAVGRRRIFGIDPPQRACRTHFCGFCD
jgi:hypothetical protein